MVMATDARRRKQPDPGTLAASKKSRRGPGKPMAPKASRREQPDLAVPIEPKKPRRPRRKRGIVRSLRSMSLRRRMTRQRYAAYGVGCIALVLTGLSLSHLASGVQLLTQSGAPAAWAMAVGFDLSFVGLELSQLCAATAQGRREVTRFAGPAVKATMAVSAMMNAYAFASSSPDIPSAAAAVALGVSIPALIYVLTRVSVAMWIDGEKA